LALNEVARAALMLAETPDRRGEEYRLHPLFQNFASAFAQRDSADRASQPSISAARATSFERQAWEPAVRHLLAAEDFVSAAGLIADRGVEWISTGALGSLSSLADSLPPGGARGHPRALAHRAEVARLQGEYEFAHSLLRRAVPLLHERADNEGEADALHSLATLARREGDYELAFSYLDRAILLSEANSAVRMKCANTRGLCLVAMGEWTPAEREFRAALQAAEERNDEYYIRLIAHNLGTPAGMRGDFGEALRCSAACCERNGRTADVAGSCSPFEYGSLLFVSR